MVLRTIRSYLTFNFIYSLRPINWYMRTTFSFEDYLTKFSQDLRNAFVKFRTTNHRLSVETGRWQHVDVYNFLVYYLMMNVRWMIDKMYNGWLSKYMDIKKNTTRRK